MTVVKKRLNGITILLVVAFGLRLYSIMGEEWYDFKLSFKEGYESARRDYRQETHSLYLRLLPDGNTEMPDSVYNKKTESWIPARMSEAVVTVPDHRIFLWETILMIPLVLILIPVSIFGFVQFFKLINAVNKSIIFDWANVRRLRIIGVAYIIAFVIHFCVEALGDRAASLLVEIPGYRLVTSDLFEAGSLLLGLAAFLIAEIFAVGLRLKEEQDLTI